MLQICHGYCGNDPVVRNFFFGTVGFRGEIMHSDRAVLATKGTAIVGGILMRGQEIVCQRADSDEILEKLLDYLKKS